MENKASQSVSSEGKEGIGDNPLVSIITSVLNGIKYLEPCIQSVLNQSYPYIEHIFVDGGSTDGTLELLSSHRARHPERIRFISEPDKGAEEAWNKGWKIARGEIFGWLGSDDMFEPGAIQTVIEFFRANPDACFVFGGCNIINERGEVIGKVAVRDFDLEEAISDSCLIPAPSAFYRREVIEKVGFMDTSIHACDLDYWIRVGKVFELYQIETTLANFRHHKDSTSGSEGIHMIYTREGYIISRRHGGSIFSKRARRYYRVVIIERLRPILGPIYPFIWKALDILPAKIKHLIGLG